MTELVLNGKIDEKKLDSIINFLRAWDIDVEVKVSQRGESETGKKERRNAIISGSFPTKGLKFNRDQANEYD
ncbi:MAG: hypothetical protein WCZ43_00815 [Proteiniphilum sp.]